VQALDVAPLGLATAVAASESMLLLGVAVRGYSSRCREMSAAADITVTLTIG
jgi:hypothetical protein